MRSVRRSVGDDDWAHHFRRFGLTLATAVAIFLGQAALAATYEYDELGRVIKVTYDDGSVVEYEYDEAGNRIEVDGTT